jgi:hypothetical protein
VRLGAIAAFLVVLLGLGSPVATAAPASLAIDTLKPELKAAESGSGSTVELKFANLTTLPAALEVEAPDNPDCKPDLSEPLLAPSLITPVKVELPQACGNEALALRATASLPGSAPQVFEIDAEGEVAKNPDWHKLWAFGWFLLGAIVLMAGLYLWWLARRGWETSKPWQPLTSLDATWKFNDNWATNATAAGALLTGLFGATTAKAFLGPNAESLTSLATVGGTIALALVAAAPIVALAMKSFKRDSNGKRGDAFTVAGVLAAAALVLAAAAGQLWVVAYTVSQLGLGSAGDLVWVAFGLALALLLAYSLRSLNDIFERGTAPKSTEPPVEIEAATLIVDAIKATTSSGRQRSEAVKALGKRLESGKKAAVEGYRRRPRSALI